MSGLLLTDVRKLEDRLRLGLVQDLQGISRSTGKILRRQVREPYWAGRDKQI